MDSRTLLAFGLVALLAVTAGCSAEGSLSMQPVDDSELAAEASTELTEDPPDRDRAVARNAIANGSATAVGEHPPVDEALPFRHQGRFYAVNYTEADTKPGYEVNVRIDYNASSVDGEVVAYDDLSAVDRRLLDDALRRTDLPEERLQPGYDFGVGHTYTDGEADSSVLVGDHEYDAVRYEGEIYPIAVSVERTTLTVYRYEATVVANSSEAYARQLRDRYEFELSGLSDGEREIVEDALNDTSYMENDDNEAFASLVDRFRAHEPVEETEYRGSYVVRYDGQLYWAEMHYGSYVEA